MPTTISLEYPEGTPISRVKDDLNTVLRGFGSISAAPSVVVSDDDADTEASLVQHVTKQGFTAGTGGI